MSRLFVRPSDRPDYIGTTFHYYFSRMKVFDPKTFDQYDLVIGVSGTLCVLFNDPGFYGKRECKQEIQQAYQNWLVEYYLLGGDDEQN